MAERKDPNLTTIKALFAKSGNQCAYPGCDHPLVDDRNLFVAELCHIHAVKKADARFDPSLSVDELRDYSNLILLCHAHHKRIDSFEDEFPAEALRAMKTSHESSFGNQTYDAPTSAVAESALQVMSATWTPPLDQVLDQLKAELDTGVAVNFTTVNMCFVIDAKLFYVYTELFQQLSAEDQIELYEEQLEWREYRHQQAESSTGGGSAGTIDYSETYMNLTEQRIESLSIRTGALEVPPITERFQ